MPLSLLLATTPNAAQDLTETSTGHGTVTYTRDILSRITQATSTVNGNVKGKRKGDVTIENVKGT